MKIDQHVKKSNILKLSQDILNKFHRNVKNYGFVKICCYTFVFGVFYECRHTTSFSNSVDFNSDISTKKMTSILFT